MSDTTETDNILEMRNLHWYQLQEFARKLERERDEARDYIEKMDAVIDDCGIAKSCINPLEDLKRATTAVKERAAKAEAQLAERDAEIARLREEFKQYLNEATK